jgi:hypothetical protein
MCHMRMRIHVLCVAYDRPMSDTTRICKHVPVSTHSRLC